MVIDLDKCTACQACVVACKVENNVPISSPEDARRGRVMLWMELIAIVEGEFPHLKTRFIPRPCMHCDRAPCIKVCPTRATYKNDEGLIAQVYGQCIGCRYCANNCPYTVKYFNWFKPQWPETLQHAINPDVSVRPKGVIEKCTFCHHRLIKAREEAKAEGRGLRHEDYVPACVQSCPSNAMYFGDLDDENSMVWRLSHSPRAFRLLEELGTEPKVIYLSEERPHA
jgi:molybdopterin-containing oxidoreductase family iron-sulfur binding subunit